MSFFTRLVILRSTSAFNVVDQTTRTCRGGSLRGSGCWHGLPQAAKEELTIGTVNNADMILMQRLSKEFEKKSGIKLHWVVLGESVLRQRLTVDISTGSNTFDVITIGSYETPLWGARGWLVPLDDLGRIINTKIFFR